MPSGATRNRYAACRKAVAPWIYRRVLERVGHKAQENRVALAAVSPAYSSTTCPVCGECNKLNRCGENFTCVVCHHTDDADTVGARNILARTLTIIGNVEFPMLKRIMK